MSNIVPFIFDAKGQVAPVRVVMQEGVPWFIATDVCRVLGINKHRDALARLDEDERGSVIVDTLGGPQQAAAVSESGLYALVLRSRKPAARQFRKWITAEVLPSIRKTGKYECTLPIGDLRAIEAYSHDHQRRILTIVRARADAEGTCRAALESIASAAGLATETVRRKMILSHLLGLLILPEQIVARWLAADGKIELQ